MPLDERYFVTSDLDTYFVDKDSGLPLAAGTLTFYRDVARTTPKLVYQLSGAPPNYTYTALPNPIVLSSVGTVQDAGGDNIVIYYFPFDDEGNLDLYFVDVRDSLGVQQLTREAWPNITAATNPTQNDFPTQNQIANSQFTQVFLNQGQATVYTVSSATDQVFAFAPDWDFVISGTGTVTVQQIAIAGNNNVPTSPPYVLDVSLSGGITICNLRQRFNVNSGLWSSTTNQAIFLAGTLIAINQNSGTTGIEMFYAESTGGIPIVILDAAFDNSAYQLLTGVSVAPIPQSTNTDTGNEGYIDIYLSFNPNSHVRISSIQVVPTIDEAGGNFLQYELNSSNREQAFMGDYYIPRLNSRPSPSVLTAWDFPLNPFQFAASGNLTNTAAYICDQTIGFAGATGNVGFAQDAVTNGLALTTAGTSDAFYIMQYLSGAEAKKILGTPLSVNVFGYVTSVSSAVTMQVYLCRAPSTSTIPTLPTSIGTVATNGIFTLTAAGWTQIPRSGLDTPTAILPVISTDSDINNPDNDMPFTGWEITDNTQISDTEFFAIVVTFAYIDTGTTLTINSISLIPSEIPARPAAESFQEVVSKCQYYYEKSYDIGDYAGTITNNGILDKTMLATLNAGTYGAVPLDFSIIYNTRKRIPVTPTIYAKDGMVATVFVQVFHASTLGNSGDAAITNWSQVSSGETSALFRPVDFSVAILGANSSQYIASTDAGIYFHFIADARLGIV
jgi:hypothetical protein